MPEYLPALLVPFVELHPYLVPFRTEVSEAGGQGSNTDNVISVHTHISLGGPDLISKFRARSEIVSFTEDCFMNRELDFLFTINVTVSLMENIYSVEVVRPIKTMR